MTTKAVYPLAASLVAVSLVGVAIARHQAPWPNLERLTGYSHPASGSAASGQVAAGDTCTANGDATPGTIKAKNNRLKNRWRIGNDPTARYDSAEEMDFVSLARLAPGDNEPIPSPYDDRQQKFVKIEGWVRYAGPSGSSGESCNCGTKVRSQLDTHIEIVPDNTPELMNRDSSAGPVESKGVVIVETTERSRRLAAEGLLRTNIGTNWSHGKLKSKLVGKRVRFYGYLFFDYSHVNEDWRTDPQDVRDVANWRESCWEIHPVMGIEVL